VAIGIVTEPEPEMGSALNFSPRPRIAPPPFGREIDGAVFEFFELSLAMFVEF
jgi:hypothetical protein